MYTRFLFPLVFYFILMVFLYADGPGTGKYDFTVNNPEIEEGDIVYSFPGYDGRKAAAGIPFFDLRIIYCKVIFTCAWTICIKKHH